MDKLRTYGLVGYPIKHSYSPFMHKAAFDHLKLKAEYKLFELKPDEVPAGAGQTQLLLNKDKFNKILESGVSGLNITVPYKVMVMERLDEVSKSAELIGAVNTIIIDKTRLKGENTDGKGFIETLKQEIGEDPKGKNIFIFGAGGAAKAIGFELALKSANSLVICDIFKEKAVELVACINNGTGCKAKAISPKDNIEKEIELSNLLINASTCGTKENRGSPLDKKLLHKGLVVCDIIYNPSETQLIKDAKEKGLVTMNGVGMLLHQGALSFKFWTGKEAPVDIMREALEKEIASTKN